MANMEMHTANLLNTTTQLVLESNTGTGEFLFNGNVLVGYSTDGYTSDTSTIISVEFAETTTVSHILLQNHNFKDYQIFYNSSTANSLFTATSASITSTYIEFATTAVSSIQIQIDAAQTEVERSLGELTILENRLSFERNPSIKNYKPQIFRKQVRHEMSDGGITLFNIRDKYRTKLKWDFITTSFHNSLKSIYDDGAPVYFVPFPTTTSWDGNGYEVVWPGKFDFKHSTNDKGQGFSGNVVLEQTSNE